MWLLWLDIKKLLIDIQLLDPLEETTQHWSLNFFLWTIRIRIMACLRIIANSLWTHAFESHGICHNKRYCCSKSIWDKCVNVFCTDEASWIRRIGKITSRSGVWNHVKVNGKDETLVKCDYCAWTSNYYSSTTNLWRHLKRLHNIEAWTLFMNSFLNNGEYSASPRIWKPWHWLVIQTLFTYPINLWKLGEVSSPCVRCNP